LSSKGGLGVRAASDRPALVTALALGASKVVEGLFR